MMPASLKKESVRHHFDPLAAKRDEWFRKNQYYYKGLYKFFSFNIFDLLFGAAKMSLKIVEIPVHDEPKQYGDTQIFQFRHGCLLLKMVVFAMNKIKFV